MKHTRPIPIALAVLVLVAACSSSGNRAGGSASVEGCSPSALDDVKGVVEVSLWNDLAPRERSSLEALIKDFNGSNPHVHVSLSDKSPTEHLANDFLTADPGARPDLVTLAGDAIQPAVDQRLVVPAQNCLDATDRTFADLVPGALASAAIDGVQWGVPFGASGDVLTYNRAAFRRAGLDPDRPPLTLEDVASAGRTLIAGGGVATGLSVPDPVPLFLAARVTPDHLDSDTGLAVARWLADAGRSGVAQPSTSHEGLAAVLDLGNGRSGMAIAQTTQLPGAAAAIHAGQAPGLELGVASLPTPSGTTAVPFRADALFLSAESSAEKRAAAWAFLTWLVEPAQQARFASETDFYPVNTKAPALEPLASQWKDTPELAAGWKALTGGQQVGDLLTAPRPYLMRELRNGGDRSLYQSSEPDTAMKDAAARAAVDLAGYAADRARYARCAFAGNACHIDAQLVVLDAAGTIETAITDVDSRAVVPAWSPDGMHIAFESNQDEVSEIYVIDADGKNRRRLTNSPDADSQPAWTPDGSRILFWSRRTGNGDIYSMAADGTDVRRLTVNDDTERKPAVSPDGLHVTYVRETDGRPDIWVMGIDGGDERRLTTTIEDDIAPVWSSDGTQIVFNSNRDPRYGLYIMNADGTDQHPLAAVATALFADVSPDGQHVAYELDWPSAIAVADRDGSNPRAITHTLATYITPSWAPDGQHIVASRHRWPNQTQ